MSALAVRIVAEAPLAFPERKPGTQFRPSLPYVPGTVLYGALGQRLAATGAFDPALLRAVRCHNAYPAAPGDRWVRPLPMTAIAPKSDPATLADSLYARVCWEQQRPAALVYAPTGADGRSWDTVGRRFYTLGPGRALELRKATQRTLTRVTINRRRGTAEDQRLYSLLALSEVQEGVQALFLGSVSCPDGMEAQLQAPLEQIEAVGARQTTGMGAVSLEVSGPAIDDAAAIRRRVRAMTERFTAQAARYERLGGTPWKIRPESLFTVNLLADAVLYEQGWLPTTELSAAQLERHAGVKARLVRSFSAPATVGGWQVLWQRPKPTETVVSMGGVFLFEALEPLTEADYSRLADLQRDGVGERRSEGFGQVRICDALHVPETEEES